jgi:hypothetical protein
MIAGLSSIAMLALIAALLAVLEQAVICSKVL